MATEDTSTGPRTGAPDVTARLAAGLAHEINNPAAVVRHDLEQIAAGRGDAVRLAEHALVALDRIVQVGRWLINHSSPTADRPEDAVLDLTMFLRDQPVSSSGQPAHAFVGRARMLIIDDDPDVRLVMQEAAEANLFSTTVVGSVAEGIAAIASGLAADIVLCDLMMPDGGAETWLRESAVRFPHLAARTIIVTGGPGSADALSFAEAHSVRVLYKPFAMADVRAMASRMPLL